MSTLFEDLVKKSTDNILGVDVLDKKKFMTEILDEVFKALDRETIIHDGFGYNQMILHGRIRKHFGLE